MFTTISNLAAFSCTVNALCSFKALIISVADLSVGAALLNPQKTPLPLILVRVEHQTIKCNFTAGKE